VTFYHWLGAEAEAAEAEAETYAQLVAELPCLDEEGEDG
jgi:hypothetical protein